LCIANQEQGLLLPLVIPADLDKITILYNLENMDNRYPSTSQPAPKVQDLPPVTATALKNSTADILDRVTTQGAVAITRHDKPRAVLIPIDLYERLTGDNSLWLADLHEEYQGVLEEMQDPKQKEAAKRAFNATPEELGAAAVRGALRKASYYA
jgi:antitoxin Phd